MRNIHFKTCTCLLGMLLILFSGIQVKGASLEVQQESKISGTVTDERRTSYWRFRSSRRIETGYYYRYRR